MKSKGNWKGLKTKEQRYKTCLGRLFSRMPGLQRWLSPKLMTSRENRLCSGLWVRYSQKKTIQVHNRYSWRKNPLTWRWIHGATARPPGSLQMICRKCITSNRTKLQLATCQLDRMKRRNTYQSRGSLWRVHAMTHPSRQTEQGHRARTSDNKTSNSNRLSLVRKIGCRTQSSRSLRRSTWQG